MYAFFVTNRPTNVKITLIIRQLSIGWWRNPCFQPSNQPQFNKNDISISRPQKQPLESYFQP